MNDMMPDKLRTAAGNAADSPGLLEPVRFFAGAAAHFVANWPKQTSSVLIFLPGH
jgi:hypothetical protein